MWTLAVQNSDELIYIWSLYTCSDCRKCMTFKDIFPGLSRTKVIFQDFPGPGIFKKKSRTFQEAWEPWPMDDDDASVNVNLHTALSLRNL